MVTPRARARARGRPRARGRGRVTTSSERTLRASVRWLSPLPPSALSVSGVLTSGGLGGGSDSSAAADLRLARWVPPLLPSFASSARWISPLARVRVRVRVADLLTHYHLLTT